eukprot:UN4976
MQCSGMRRKCLTMFSDDLCVGYGRLLSGFPSRAWSHRGCGSAAGASRHAGCRSSRCLPSMQRMFKILAATTWASLAGVQRARSPCRLPIAAASCFQGRSGHFSMRAAPRWCPRSVVPKLFRMQLTHSPCGLPWIGATGPRAVLQMQGQRAIPHVSTMS